MFNLASLPAAFTNIATFIVYQLKQNFSLSIIQSYVYAIHWYHDLFAPENENPAHHKTVKYLMDACKRICKKPRKKKDPITPNHLASMAHIIGGLRANLLELRNFTMILIAFAGFLRFDELSDIKAHDVTFYSYYMTIFIEKSKCDQYRDGT